MNRPRFDWLRNRMYLEPELCSATDPNRKSALEQLDMKMFDFYNSRIDSEYFETAEGRNEVWTPKMKAHWHLKRAIPVGSRVVDLGCGSAHPCRNLTVRKVRYTGVDWSGTQIARNRAQMPEHVFIAASLYDTPLPHESFDVAISLSVIEHLVWPHHFLDEMYRLVRPGGLIGILSPPIRISNSIQSIAGGSGARPLADELESRQLIDASFHRCRDRESGRKYPNEQSGRDSEPNRFLVNLKPVCLKTSHWFPGADAVYMTYTKEVVEYLAAKGADLLEEWPRHAYILMRKTALSSREKIDLK